MEKNSHQRIIFNLPGETTTAEVMLEILKNNKLEENKLEFLKKSIKGEDTHLSIIRDATFTMVEKKIPEEKLVELSAKHLGVPKDSAERIVADIKQKLIPYAQIIDMEKIRKETDQNKKEQKSEYNKENFREELLNKIRQGKPAQTEESDEELPSSYPKKPEITDVDKNAQKLKKERGPITSIIKEKIPQESPPQTKPDPYKEQIE